jgi:hypothetical protein
MTVPIVSLVGKVDSGDVPMSPILDREGELHVMPSEDRDAERTLVVESTSLFEGEQLLYQAGLQSLNIFVKIGSNRFLTDA